MSTMPRVRNHPRLFFYAVLLLFASMSFVLNFQSPASVVAAGNLTIPTNGQVTQLFLARDLSDYTGSYYDQNDQLKTTSISVHDGVDISNHSLACDHSSPVYAAAGGTVYLARYDYYGWGWQVVIDHGRSISNNGKYVFTRYAHMGTPNSTLDASKCITVSEGQFVSAGQLIGYQGSSGRSTGTHLHWGIYVNPSGDNWYSSLRIPASSDFYTCIPLTLGDAITAISVTAGQNLCVTGGLVGNIRGKVKYSSGQAVSGATLIFIGGNRPMATTDGNGLYVFSNVPAGPVQIMATDPITGQSASIYTTVYAYQDTVPPDISLPAHSIAGNSFSPFTRFG